MLWPLALMVAVVTNTACFWQGETTSLQGVQSRLTVLHTSDIHSRLLPYHLAPTATDRKLGLHPANAPFGGAARLGYLIRRERNRSQRVLHLDSGDCFQGAPIFNQNLGVPELRFMSLIGVDAAVIGNHEFDAGVHNLVKQLHDWADYDVLAANYVMPDADDLNQHALANVSQPFALYNLDGLRVAVIGMGNLGSLTSIGEGGNSLKLSPLEQNETVRGYVNLLHDFVDLVVVLTHLGLHEDIALLQGYETPVWEKDMPANWTVVPGGDLGDGRVMAKVPGVKGIDLIVGGHLHVVLNPPKIVKDTDGREVVLMHSGAFAKYLGRLDLVVGDDLEWGGKRVLSHKYQVFPVDNRLAPYEDSQVNAMLEPFYQQLHQRLDLNKVIGYAPMTLMRRSTKGNGDSELGNLVTEAMRSRRRVHADIAITNTLGIRDNLYQGEVTLEDMFNIFPFENTLVLMYLSGSEVQEMMDFIARRSAGRGCQSQAQIAGMRFTMDCGLVQRQHRGEDLAEHAGQDILIGGQPLAINATYRMATNDYIGRGGSGFQVLKRNTTLKDSGLSLRDVLIDYFRTLPTCAAWERETSRVCDRQDPSSKKLCADVGGVGRIQETPDMAGRYAAVPCLVGVEDSRIRRLTSSDDTVDKPDSGMDGDADEPTVVP